MLSLRACSPSPGVSRPKYPLFMFSMLRIVGGDFELGLAIEFPLPLLELFRLLPCRSLARWKFIRLLTAGDCPTQPFPGLACAAEAKGPLILFICGVDSIESSISSASMRSSSSELLPDESDPNIFTLPSELDTTILSEIAIVDHSELELLIIDSELLEKWRLFFLLGMFIALPEMVGDESGEDCSASVE